MSTRADFYLGRGRKSVYLGSVGHDAGYPELQHYFEGVKTPEAFRAALKNVFADFGEISADYGWPWAWKTSDTTDTVICLHDGRVWHKHWSRRWAPLDRPNRPSRARCRFPDMTRGLDSPEGRLRRRIALMGGSFRVRANEDVLGPLLVRTAYALTRFWMHAFVGADGRVYTLEPFENSRWTLHDVLEVACGHPQELKELVAARRLKEPSPVWELLEWACENRWLTWLGREDGERLPLTPEQPTYFALPVPDSVPRDTLPRELSYKLIDPQLYARGSALLEAAHQVLPFVFGYAVLHELGFMKGKHLADEELQKHAFLADGSTRENRLLARKYAQNIFWE